MNLGSNQGDTEGGRAPFLVIDAAKETHIARFLSLACTVGDCNAAFILLPANKEGLFFVNPATDFMETSDLWPLYQETIAEGSFLEISDLKQQPELKEISF